MSETPSQKPVESADESSAVVALEPGPVGTWLNQQGFEHEVLAPDHLGVEQIRQHVLTDKMLCPPGLTPGFFTITHRGRNEPQRKRLMALFPAAFPDPAGNPVWQVDDKPEHTVCCNHHP